jgi:site-specific DNA-methyltransferase (adenine-specific)
MEYNKIHLIDSNEFLSKFSEYEFDMIFADPPYALGSEVIIRKDGKVDYAKASDFMNKWEMPTGLYWEKWFINAYRTLKHGGWLIMYGMDRQTLLFKYYASLAGFDEQQSLYWYFISNFPKATSLPLTLDKQAGVQGQRGIGGFNVSGKGEQDNRDSKLYKKTNNDNSNQEAYNTPKTEIAKKYDGYKYSVAPLKQTCETIMVFKKPNKTGSVLHDTLAMENGDTTISVSALNIDDNRVALKEGEKIPRLNVPYEMKADNNFGGGHDNRQGTITVSDKEGRYPAQSFIDEQVASRLDLQSQNASVEEQGCSKILHKIKYEQYDHDLFIYEPKVGEAERNNGLGGFEAKQYSHDGRDKPIENPYQRNESVAKNNHPTLKPIDLNSKVLKLFKTPNDQKICYPFAGSGSEIIGGLQAGFSHWVACEINEEYVKIANARIKHYTTHEYVEVPLFDD